MEIYLYFKNNPTRWSCLAKLAESLNIKLFVIPKPTGTRFVAHKRNALYAIRWNLLLLVLHFSNGGDDGATAAGYLADNFLNFRFLSLFSKKYFIIYTFNPHLIGTLSVFLTYFFYNTLHEFTSFNLVKVAFVTYLRRPSFLFVSYQNLRRFSNVWKRKFALYGIIKYYISINGEL